MEHTNYSERMQGMNDQQLQAWVEAVSLQFFTRAFRHQARFNARLSACGGRYLPRCGSIEISYKHWQAYGEEEVLGIIKHELCHYHLHQQKRPYKHRDHAFKQLLAHVGGARYCQMLPERSQLGEGGGVRRKEEPYRYRIVCQNCKKESYRKRSFQVVRYRCAFCHGKLSLFRIAVPGDRTQNVQS
jgi:SprT-like protein